MTIQAGDKSTEGSGWWSWCGEGGRNCTLPLTSLAQHGGRSMEKPFLRTVGTLALALSLVSPVSNGWTASHREAPLIALDPAADITDVYAFRSWANPGKVVFIMNVIPGEDPSDGPN